MTRSGLVVPLFSQIEVLIAALGLPDRYQVMDEDNFDQPIIRRGEDAEAAAAQWHVRLHSGNASGDDRERFAIWCRDPENAAVYADLEAIWNGMGEILAKPHEVVPFPQRRRTSPFNWRAIASAAAMVLVVLGGVQYVRVWQFDFVAEGTEREHIILADGSSVDMNAGAALDFSQENGERRAVLARGEAYFDVVHDPARPFIISAGEGEVRVLGTAFSVRRHGDGAMVTVRRGRVQVTSRSNLVEITQGQQFAYADGKEGAVVTVDPDVELAWQSGRLILKDRPLGEVIEALGRHYPARMILLGDDLAKRRVNAVVDLDHIDIWLSALARSQDIRIRKIPGFVFIS